MVMQKEPKTEDLRHHARLAEQCSNVTVNSIQPYDSILTEIKSLKERFENVNAIASTTTVNSNATHRFHGPARLSNSNQRFNMRQQHSSFPPPQPPKFYSPSNRPTLTNLVNNNNDCSPSFKNCYFCGFPYSPRHSCPARNAVCHFCRKRDIFQEFVWQLKGHNRIRRPSTET